MFISVDQVFTTRLYLPCGEQSEFLVGQGGAILRTLIVGSVACLSAAGASAATIYADNFDGAGNVAGNSVPGWTQYEENSGGVSLIDYGSPHHLVMALTGQPDAAAATGIISTAGYTNITISFDWLRKGTESNDAFYFSYIVNPGG
jgi:hypothetical protein